MRKLFVAVLVIASLFKTETIYTMEPQWALWGNPEYVRYDAEHHKYVNHNTELELWRLGTPASRPEEVPVKQETVIVFRLRSRSRSTRTSSRQLLFSSLVDASH